MTRKVKDRPLRESVPLVFLAAIVMMRRAPCSVAICRRAGEFWKAADRLCRDVVCRPLGGCYALCISRLPVPHCGGVWCGGTSIEERAL